jgi:F-type H+-transporting ATPase subunit delta
VRASRAVAKSYAKALFELAAERGQVETIGRELATLGETVEGAPELVEFLSRPWVGPDAKRTTATEVATRAALSPLARDFFRLVVAQGRADHLVAIADAYRELADEAAGRVRARVRTAVPLTEADRQALAARIGRELGGKHVILDETVDPSLLGGFVAEVGSLVLDGSLDGQLARLRHRLVHA